MSLLLLSQKENLKPMRATQKLEKALRTIVQAMSLPWPEKVTIEPPRDPKHGDLAVNIAMVLAREAKSNPRHLAEHFAQELPHALPEITHIDIAGPGFLNIIVSPGFWQSTIMDIEAAGTHYGKSTVGQGCKVNIEFVSANPTGPLHIGHGRGAAVGDSIARLLRFAGYDAHTEYYINDAGRQMRLLGLSVWLRAQEIQQLPIDWPDEYYRGAYIIDITHELLSSRPTLLDMPPAKAQDICYEYAMKHIMAGIQQDLQEFRVEHEVWFSEKSLLETNKTGATGEIKTSAVQASFDRLKSTGHSYEKDGALWFATVALGDDKDRVLVKSDGSLTYFASDIAYHDNKFQRGFDYCIDVWGADHHGYIPRMRAALTALGRAPEDFDVVLIQLVNLLENGTPVSMSTRAGTFETLADVIKEVGVDAARFMFLWRKSDSPLDFDLEIVKQRTLENPVYYVQYAHARSCAVLRRAAERGIMLPTHVDATQLIPLDTPEDRALLRMLARFEDMVRMAARTLGVHHISHYLMEVAGALHSYYAKHQIIVEDELPRTCARLALLRAVAQVIRNGLEEILGVSAPDTM